MIQEQQLNATNVIYIRLHVDYNYRNTIERIKWTMLVDSRITELFTHNIPPTPASR